MARVRELEALSARSKDNSRRSGTSSLLLWSMKNFKPRVVDRLRGIPLRSKRR